VFTGSVVSRFTCLQLHAIPKVMVRVMVRVRVRLVSGLGLGLWLRSKLGLGLGIVAPFAWTNEPVDK